MIPAAKSNFAEFTFSACCNDYIRHKFLDLLSLVKVVETKFRGQRTPSPHSKSPLPSTSQREDVQYVNFKPNLPLSISPLAVKPNYSGTLAKSAWWWVGRELWYL